MKTGIYSILCIPNRKLYIGQAVDIHKRWSNHKTDLKRGIHKNPHLQRAWDLYGESMFTFSIILECEKEVLNENEKYYIETLEAIDQEKGFNMCVRCEEKRFNRKINSLLKKERKLKKVVILDKITGEYIRTLDSIKNVAEDLGASLKILQEVVLRKKKFGYKDYILVYEDEYDSNIDYRHIRKPKSKKEKIKKERKKREGSHNEIPILVEKQGVILEFKSIAEAARYLNTKNKYIYRCLSGERNNYKGYKFSKINLES